MRDTPKIAASETKQPEYHAISSLNLRPYTTRWAKFLRGQCTDMTVGRILALPLKHRSPTPRVFKRPPETRRIGIRRSTNALLGLGHAKMHPSASELCIHIEVFRLYGNSFSGMSRVAFLLGSGISYASGAPTVTALTDSVLNGAWWQHTDLRFYPRPSSEEQISAGIARLAQEFLCRLSQEITPHLQMRENRSPNYEDIYAAARQLLDDETGEILSPLIAATLKKIKGNMVDLCAEVEPHIDGNAFASLTEKAIDLIQFVVFHGLAPVQKPVKLRILTDITRHVEETNIFSLNHDLLLEAQANEANVRLVDGFGKRIHDVRIFNGDWSINDDVARLIKLHGSINWNVIRSGAIDQFATILGNSESARGIDGKLINSTSITPLFLTGTTVKERAYGIGPFGELFNAFRSLLSRHRTLVCSGYGWGDKGINIRLRQWLRDAKENRIVLLDARQEEEIAGTRMWWARWDMYKAAGKVVHIRKWLGDCTLEDLKPYFDP